MLKNAAMIVVVVLVVLAIAAVALRGRSRPGRGAPTSSAPATVRKPTFSLSEERDRRAERAATRDEVARRVVERARRAADEQRHEPGA
ncbi:hypothetical protein [Nocardioides flavescens]|uniref:Uncharacterized protein n=1 Tax=Nocardioides flavescens TaxID=2691959 RepID=A0A6L7EWB8_9ACTN|nr:hypothetical protein [Nocardioides flavescens]MXG89688.1 hypothetical protein [Nocardioides flavescens]